MSDSSEADMEESDSPPYLTPHSTKPRQIYTCDICGKKLSRPAHLQRHRLLHSTSNAEIFQCQLCGKQFTRKDVYQRHKRGVHGSAQTERTAGRKKSCRRCIRYKLRCTRESSCTSCVNRGVQCIYDARGTDNGRETLSNPSLQDQVSDHGTMWSTTRSSAMLPSAALENMPASAANPENQWNSPSGCHPPTFGEVNVPTELSTNVAADIGNSPVRQDLQFRSNDSQEDFATSCELEEQFVAQRRRSQASCDVNHSPANHTQSDEYQARSMSTTNPPPYQYQYSSDCQASEALDTQYASINTDTFDWNNFRASRMDWLGCETEWSDRQSLPSESFVLPEMHQIEEQSILSPDPTIPVVSALHTSDTSYPAREKQMDLAGLVDGKGEETWPGILDRGGNETWPFDYTSNKGFRKIKLPPLRQILEQTVGDRPAIEKSTLMDLIKILSAPHIPSLNDSPALEALPAVAFLSQYTNMFFAEFQAVLPVMHVPTWRIEKCPTALLAAIACIGATYSTAEGSEEISALLAEITQRALFWMGQSDSTAFRNPAYITATCFHQIYSLGTGNRRLYELADASRGLLVTSLRGLGVLLPESEHEDSAVLDYTNLKQLNAAALESKWLRWRDKEMEKRMAWSVFEFDCTLCTLTSKRGAFSIAELPARLPCSESVWEAHSSQAWASMLPFASSPATGLLFYPLLRDIIAQKPALAQVPAWAKRLCAQAIGRLLWDLREIEDASTPSILGLPSLGRAHNETKTTLLKSLTALHDSLSRPTCTSDLVNMNIGCLVMHYCHLSNEALDLVVYIFRNSGRETNPFVSNELRRSKEHLRYIFGRDPIGTRRLACHAASIVGIARECTINTPCETMRVFMGFAFLLAFNKFFPFQTHERDDTASNVPQPSTIRLDDLPWTRSHVVLSRVEHWVHCGGSASLESVGNICDICNFAALKQTALKALHDLRVWGIAGKFFRTIKNFT